VNFLKCLSVELRRVKDPLNSGDDVSDADPTEVFDADNVIVCQFDKVGEVC